MTSKQAREVGNIIETLIESTTKSRIPYRFYHVFDRVPKDREEVYVITEDGRVDTAFFSKGPGESKFICHPTDLDNIEWWMPKPRRQAV